MIKLKTGEKGIVALAAVLLLLAGIASVLPGIQFTVYLCVGIAALCILGLFLNRLAKKNIFFKRCKAFFLFGIALLFVLLSSAEIFVITRGETDFSALPADAVIVLGAGVNGERPSMALQTRIDAAADYLRQHPDVPVVLSGGMGPGERITEAEAMRRALWTDSAAWNERYLTEERSTSTAENFAYSKELLAEHGIDVETAVIAVVTNDFHIARAQILAQKNGYGTVIGVPAELPWWWLNANYYAREAFAMIKTLIFD